MVYTAKQSGQFTCSVKRQAVAASNGGDTGRRRFIGMHNPQERKNENELFV